MDTDFQIRLLNRLEQSIDRLNERLDGFEKTIAQSVTPVELRVHAIEVELGKLKLIAGAGMLVASASITGVISLVLPNLINQSSEVRK